MSFSVRDGKFDVAIVAGPRLEHWPSAGVRALAVLCTEMGLNVGQFGGESINVRGVIPLPGTGGLVLIEDVQKRVHRIHARAIVRVNPESYLPDPFPGWRSQGLIPLSTAERLRKETQHLWNPMTAILGTGNRALRFGSTLLESGVPTVVCIESYTQWGAKRFAGWEVERRRFEMIGGRLIEAKPIQLLPKSALLWQLRLQDSQGIRVLDIGRCVSAGPFKNTGGVREHPPGSFLFEFEQTAALTYPEDVEGWNLEEERGRWLAGKIARALITDLGPKKEELDRITRRTKGRLKRYFRHREEPFTPSYQGKWIGISDLKKMRGFSGTPDKLHFSKLIASVECFEDISCNICQKVCPTSAIQIGKVARSKNMILNESACTSCGLCLTACPSSSIVMIHEKENHPTSRLTLPWRGNKLWQASDSATLLNRKGETLGSARITQTQPSQDGVQLVQLEVPSHLLWEARSLKKPKAPAASDEIYLAAEKQASTQVDKVEIILNGEKRLVRERIPISVALFEIGQSRPEDVLLCGDGSCGQCLITADSVEKNACQTKIHRGMTIKIPEPAAEDANSQFLCPCLGITKEDVIERLKQGKLQSPEAVLSVTHVGEGKCHGQLCMTAFRRLLMDHGLDASQWIDWRFPWSDWIVSHS